MARELDKGNSIDLTKDNGTSLTSFCVGANWGQIVHRYIWGLFKTYEDVDLDLSCIMTDAQGNMVDHLYSPLYRKYFLAENGLMPGKLVTRDGSMRHSEDDVVGNDGASTNGKELKGVDIDNEYITVDLRRIAPAVQQIFFFLNVCGEERKRWWFFWKKRRDFSKIPYAYIRMYEYDRVPTTVTSIFASYNVASAHTAGGARSLIMAKLYRSGSGWKFKAIGDAYNDKNLCHTIKRILTNYSKVK